MVKEPFHFENGCMMIPEAPGIGIELAENLTEKFPPRQRSISAQTAYDGGVYDV